MNILEGGPVISFSVVELDPLLIGTYKVPIGAKVSMTQQKIITKTAVQGRSGTVKEFSGFDDWAITIEFEQVAILKAQAMGFLGNLSRQWQIQKELPVTNLRFQRLGIRYIVIEKIDLPDPDRDHEIKCVMHCISDNVIDLSDPDNMGSPEKKQGNLERIAKII